MAFLAAYHQNKGLMGTHGLQPAKDYYDVLTKRYDNTAASPVDGTVISYPTWWKQFRDHPSLFWFVELTDETMDNVILSGLTLSSLLVLTTTTHDSMLILFALWLLYFSIVTSANGTSFYSYGWESQLLETGFLAIFLCQDVFPRLTVTGNVGATTAAATTMTNKPTGTTTKPPSPIILWLFRWLIFRISIGAGLIKIRGDSCWTEKTCLLYHFETQPIPSPTSFVFHFLPTSILQKAVDLDLFVQVYTSWMVLLPTNVPRCPRRLINNVLLILVRVGGIIQAAFMLNIIVSGNLGFLPHLTIIPALACLDDACFTMKWSKQLQRQQPQSQRIKNQPPAQSQQITNNQYVWKWSSPRLWLDIAFAGLVMSLSRPVVSNLLQLDGTRQQMNASFDSFRLVGTYGAFGSVGKQRYEPIISIAYAKDGRDINTANEAASSSSDLEWIELEFPCKPGNVDRVSKSLLIVAVSSRIV
jgi:hypothetical protein